jgi:YD repeat-containing protein
MTYDLAGRKVGMNDPDMGNWSYNYNALGALINQTDARGCVTTLDYDLLNRLRGKSFSGSCGTTTAPVGYTYDAFDAATGQYGRGRRTGMTDGSGSTAWKYDLRGRMIQETKVISGDGGGTFTTSSTYNSADLPVTITYPGGPNGEAGEILTQSYDSRMLLDSVWSNLGTPSTSDDYYYQQATRYDTLGRVDFRNLGAPNLASNPLLVTDYGYYPWSGANQGDSLGRMQNLATIPSALIADSFDTTIWNSRLETYQPKANSTISLTASPGKLRLSVPNTATYNHYSSVDEAPQVRTTSAIAGSLAGDWTIETKVNLSSYTPGSNFLTGLMVYFGQYDAAYFGPYRGTHLRVTRSDGVTTPIDTAFTGSEAWLRVRKTGTTYTFEYRSSENSAWLSAGTKTWTTTPTKVGMILKTWSAVTVNADFDYFHLGQTKLQDLTYNYDVSGNITKALDVPAAEILLYGYDTLNRLNSVTKNGAAWESYTYNPVNGNLASKTGMGTYTYPGVGQARPHAVSSTSTGWSYTYDANGSMLTRTGGGKAYTYTYNAENQLVTVTGSASASFVFDGDGNRVKATQGGVSTIFVGGIYEKGKSWQSQLLLKRMAATALLRHSPLSRRGDPRVRRDGQQQERAVLRVWRSPGFGERQLQGGEWTACQPAV